MVSSKLELTRSRFSYSTSVSLVDCLMKQKSGIFNLILTASALCARAQTIAPLSHMLTLRSAWRSFANSGTRSTTFVLRQHVVFQRRDFLAQRRKGAKRCRVSKGFFFRPLRLCAFASATLRPCDFATLRLCAFAPLREKSSPHETLCANLRTLETRH
jgi:hypothetical protein